MNKESIHEFLRLIGITEYKDDNSWVRCSCPLAKWNHEGGKDERPSFGIKISEEVQSGYYCFSCQCAGKLTRLLHTLTWLTGEQPMRAINFLIDNEIEIEKIPLPEKNYFVRERETPDVPETICLAFDDLTIKYAGYPDTLYSWLVTTRNIVETTARLFQIKKLNIYLKQYEKNLDNHVKPLINCIVFPIINKKGKFKDLYARKIDKKKFFRYNAELSGSEVDYHAPGMFFGQHLYDMTKPVIIVEGAIDAMRIHTLGWYNVLATMGPPRDAQLRQVDSPLIMLGFDADSAGDKFCRKFYRSVNYTHVYKLDWSVVNCKDAGDLPDAEALNKVLANMKQIKTD